MNSERGDSFGPVRIELATSEIEGGGCRTWADPTQVLAVVSRSEPDDAFGRFVESRLHDLASEVGEPGGTAGPAPGSAPGLPLVVQTLIARLQGVHARLYRENRSLMKDPCSVQITCVLAEEERVYFVRTAPSWVGLLRDGKAYSASPAAEPDRVWGPLGRAESLNLEVTSLEVRPGDTMVLLSAETEIPPDLHAVRNLFHQTPDLKRACDGLVNLQGLISASAGAVAMRFLPVEAAPEAERENPLAGLTADFGDEFPGRILFARDPEPAPAPALPPFLMAADAQVEPAPALPPFLMAADAQVEPAPVLPPIMAADVQAVPEPVPPPVTRADVQAVPEPAPPPVPILEPAPVFASALAAPRADIPVPVPSQGRTWDERPSLLARLWPVTAALAGAVLLLLAALPRFGGGEDRRSLLSRLWPGKDVVLLGALEVDPEPPARAVFVDGEPVVEGTPAVLDSLIPGVHRIALDLGPSGTWETEVEVVPGETARLAPRLTGSVEVTTAAAAGGGMVWSEGREKVALPARLDSLPVGWNRLFFEDARIPMWDRLVLVKPGEISRVTIPKSYSAYHGVLRVEGMAYADKRGMVDSDGDSIWVDGRWTGLTPFESTVPPGLHSVRVGSGTDSYTEVLEVRAGSARHVVAQLGRGPAPALRHVAPGRVTVRGSLLLSLEIQGGGETAGLRPTLHFPELAPGSREVPLSPVDEDAGVYIGVVDAASLPIGRDVAYYFTVGGTNGETVWSDLYRLRPERPWRRGRRSSAGTAGPEPNLSETNLSGPSLPQPAGADPTDPATGPSDGGDGSSEPLSDPADVRPDGSMAVPAGSPADPGQAPAAVPIPGSTERTSGEG